MMQHDEEQWKKWTGLDTFFVFLFGVLVGLFIGGWLLKIPEADAAIGDWNDNFENYTNGTEIGDQGLWDDSFTDWISSNAQAHSSTFSVYSDSAANSQAWKNTGTNLASTSLNFTLSYWMYANDANHSLGVFLTDSTRTKGPGCSTSLGILRAKSSDGTASSTISFSYSTSTWQQIFLDVDYGNNLERCRTNTASTSWVSFTKYDALILYLTRTATGNPNVRAFDDFQLTTSNFYNYATSSLPYVELLPPLDTATTSAGALISTSTAFEYTATARAYCPSLGIASTTCTLIYAFADLASPIDAEIKEVSIKKDTVIYDSQSFITPVSSTTMQLSVFVRRNTTGYAPDTAYIHFPGRTNTIWTPGEEGCNNASSTFLQGIDLKCALTQTARYLLWDGPGTESAKHFVISQFSKFTVLFPFSIFFDAATSLKTATENQAASSTAVAPVFTNRNLSVSMVTSSMQIRFGSSIKTQIFKLEEMFFWLAAIIFIVSKAYKTPQ